MLNLQVIVASTWIKADTNVFDPGETQAKAATVMLDELLRWANALKPMRSASPPV